MVWTMDLLGFWTGEWLKWNEKEKPNEIQAKKKNWLMQRKQKHKLKNME